MPDQLSTRIPLITIGGFLGAGKTTLINHMLKQSNGKRIVIFVNDFGAINIDYDLIETVDTDRISLKNGCVCCSLNNDLISSIKSFVDDGQKPDAFVVEASGVADPRALDRSIALLEQAGTVTFDNRIYVVDCEQFQNSAFDETETIIDHAAAADLILLNKVDLVSTHDLEKVAEVLNRSAPGVAHVRTSHCRCPSEIILSNTAGHLGDMSQFAHDQSVVHHHGFVSWSQETNKRIDRSKFAEFAKHLAEICFRAKGRLFFQEQPMPSIFHLVGKRASLETSRDQDDEQVSKIVAIGKCHELDVEKLEHQFRILLN